MIIAFHVVANLAVFMMMYFAIRYFAMVVTVTKHILFPAILMMCVIGAYTINCGIMFDVWTLLIFGLFGWFSVKLRLEIPPSSSVSSWDRPPRSTSSRASNPSAA